MTICVEYDIVQNGYVEFEGTGRLRPNFIGMRLKETPPRKNLKESNRTILVASSRRLCLR